MQSQSITGGGRDHGKSLAEWYCALAGAALLFAGVAGFFLDLSWNTAADLGGPELFGLFEINGWHTLVHLVSGVVLLVAAARERVARAVALGFGLVYGAVAVWGLLDTTVAQVLPVNTADNVLHIALAVAGIAAGLVSPAVARPDERRPGVEADASAAMPADTATRRLAGDPVQREHVGRSHVSRRD